MSIRSRLTRFTLLAALLALACVGGEWGLRALGLWFPPADLRGPWRSLAEDRAMRAGLHACELDPLVLWSPRRAGPGALAGVNELGGLGALPPRERTSGAGRIALRIVLLGDAHLAGSALAPDDRIAAQLAQRLGAVELVPAAIDDFSLAQGIALWRGRVRAWRPDLVVACFPGRVECASARGGGDVAKLAALSAWTGGEATLGYSLRLAHLARLAPAACSGAWIAARESAFLGAQHENAAASGYGAFAWKGVRRMAIDEYKAAWTEFGDELAREGIELVALSIPAPPADKLPIVEGYTRAAFEAAKASGAAFVDARAALGADAAEWSSAGGRLAKAGHARVAALLAEKLAPLLAAIRAERGA
ncbi:MAG: hypothetical protein EPO68_14595 [Planctomycetota bacterium]|nr:MAG: hypothetical protein EPO68_14595 [Planctomycetota bacterium]